LFFAVFCSSSTKTTTTTTELRVMKEIIIIIIIITKHMNKINIKTTANIMKVIFDNQIKLNWIGLEMKLDWYEFLFLFNYYYYLIIDFILYKKTIYSFHYWFWIIYSILKNNNNIKDNQQIK
jgi:hypothetical protein